MSPTLGQENSSFGDRQFIVITSEKQARIVALPSQNCVYRLQITETDFIVRAEIVSMKGKLFGALEWVLPAHRMWWKIDGIFIPFFGLKIIQIDLHWFILIVVMAGGGFLLVFDILKDLAIFSLWFFARYLALFQIESSCLYFIMEATKG